jgi:hypothetical protein
MKHANQRVGRKVSVGAGQTLMIHAEGALWIGLTMSDVVSRIDYLGQVRSSRLRCLDVPTIIVTEHRRCT